MDDLELAINDFFGKGYNCSQTMMILTHQLRNRDNDELIDSLYAFGGGIHSGKTCGTLLGGCSAIATYKDVAETELIQKIIKEFVVWFEEHFGSTDCKSLVGPTREERLDVCPNIIKEATLKLESLLDENGIDKFAE